MIHTFSSWCSGLETPNWDLTVEFPELGIHILIYSQSRKAHLHCVKRSDGPVEHGEEALRGGPHVVMGVRVGSGPGSDSLVQLVAAGPNQKRNATGEALVGKSVTDSRSSRCSPLGVFFSL